MGGLVVKVTYNGRTGSWVVSGYVTARSGERFYLQHAYAYRWSAKLFGGRWFRKMERIAKRGELV